MSLEDRLSQFRGNPSNLLIGNETYRYSSFEIYVADRDFGVSEEILEAQLRNWESNLSDDISNFRDYERSQSALVELDELYLVSKFEPIRETLEWFYEGGAFERLDVETRFLDRDYDSDETWVEGEDAHTEAYFSKSDIGIHTLCISLNFAFWLGAGYLLSKLD